MSRRPGFPAHLATSLEHAFPAANRRGGRFLAVLPALPERFVLWHGATPDGVLKGVSAGVTSGMTGQDRHHVRINLDVRDELLRGSAILRLPREMPGRGIGMRPPGGPLLGGGGTDERRAVTLTPPAPAGQHLAGGSRETAVAAQ